MSEQRTPEWFAERCGLATASRFGDILARTKSGEAASRRNYRAQLVCERMTGVPQDSGFESPAMRWGTEQEPDARMAFEAATGLMVESVGFVRHDIIRAGCSPDGLIDADCGIEIKCPNTATHIETLLAGGMPPEHMAQVQGAMWITGRSSWWFVSYDPRMPEHLRMHRHLVAWDEAYISALAESVTKFLEEVAQQVEALGKITIT